MFSILKYRYNNTFTNCSTFTCSQFASTTRTARCEGLSDVYVDELLSICEKQAQPENGKMISLIVKPKLF